MKDEDFDLGWRRRAATAWGGHNSWWQPQEPINLRPLSIFGGLLSIVPRIVCLVRDHHRGIRHVEDGRIIEVRGSSLYLRCRFCGEISPGWGIEFKTRR